MNKKTGVTVSAAALAPNPEEQRELDRIRDWEKGGSREAVKAERERIVALIKRKRQELGYLSVVAQCLDGLLEEIG